MFISYNFTSYFYPNAYKLLFSTRTRHSLAFPDYDHSQRETVAYVERVLPLVRTLANHVFLLTRCSKTARTTICNFLHSSVKMLRQHGTTYVDSCPDVHERLSGHGIGYSLVLIISVYIYRYSNTFPTRNILPNYRFVVHEKVALCKYHPYTTSLVYRSKEQPRPWKAS